MYRIRLAFVYIYIYLSHLGVVSVVWSGTQIPILRFFQAAYVASSSRSMELRYGGIQA